MATKFETHLHSVANIGLGDNDHDEQLVAVLEQHANDGWALATAIYCGATLHWPAHIMLIFSKTV